MRGLILMIVGALAVLGEIPLGGLNMVEGKASLSWGNGAGNEFERICLWENLPTEMCQVLRRLREAVLISGPSPQIQKLSTILDVKDVLGRNGWIGNNRSKAAGSSHLGAKEAATCEDATPEWIVLRKLGISQFTIGLDNQILWRCIAAILPDGPKSPIVMARMTTAVFPIRVNDIRENKRSLICDQGLSGEVRLTGGCAPQGSGEGRYDDGGKGSNRPVVLVNEVPGTLDVSVSRDKDSDWVFFGGIAAVLVALLGYAGLEGWREGSFKRHQRRHDNQNRNHYS
jgi:hypothetical protein